MSDSPRRFTSSHSGFESACVEMAVVDAAPWYTSSHSGFANNCVEVALAVPRAVLLRDTRHRSAAVLAVGPREWSALVSATARS